MVDHDSEPDVVRKQRRMVGHGTTNRTGLGPGNNEELWVVKTPSRFEFNELAIEPQFAVWIGVRPNFFLVSDKKGAQPGPL
jgi:hypothetical protein